MKPTNVFKFLFPLTAACSAQPVSQGAVDTVTPRLEVSADSSAWTFDGSGVWSVGGGILRLTMPGVPAGVIRRPAALAILHTASFTEASVQLEIRSTAAAEVRQRDLQVVVGYQSPSRFYYVHLAGITDAVHNGIFLVADADRRRIDSGDGKPQLTDQTWHRVRVDWNGKLGSIAVYVDDSSEPVLRAQDATLTHGRVGVGSFDDTGEFRDLRIVGKR